MAVAGNQSAASVIEVGQGAEAVILQLEEPVLIIKWARFTDHWQGLESWNHQSKIRLAGRKAKPGRRPCEV